MFHSFRRVSMPYIPIVTNVIGIGNLAVDIFFFFSGLCLSLSARYHHYAENGWREYLIRRFDRVLIPYLIIGIPYQIWNTVFDSYGSLMRRIAVFCGNISSATFWLKGTQTTWYLFAIVFFYLLFPMLYCYLKKSSLIIRASLIVGLIAMAIAFSYLPVIKFSIDAWARLPIFTIGILYGIEEKERNITGIPVFASVLTICILGGITSASELLPDFPLPHVYRLLLYIPMTLAVCTLSSRREIRSTLLEWIGGLSLEIYLVHMTILHPIEYYGLREALGYWLYLVLPIISIGISWIVSQLEMHVLKQLRQHRSISIK